jgi:hypothetical protein
MKRPDLRKPMADREYSPVEKPIVLVGVRGFQLPTKDPCKECPLARTALPGALGGYTPEQYIEVLHGPADLACHMSPGFPDDRSRQRSCTGVAMYRANCGHGPAGKSAYDAVKATGPDGRAFTSPTEFLRHHRKGQKR